MDIEKLKFPIGKYKSLKRPSDTEVERWIKNIEEFPSQLERLVNGISVEKLNWRYRPGGWKVKQVIHHCADSHMNSLMRFKLTLTEQMPTIRPYFEASWAELTDSLDDNIQGSLLLLNGLHQKWGTLIRNLSEDELKLEFVHPEHGEKVSLLENISIYAWHCNHHLAHINHALESGGSYS